ncbi:MAG: hypothetical protein EOO38_08700, partial [Cytophagaceae bacterium]
MAVNISKNNDGYLGGHTVAFTSPHSAYLVSEGDWVIYRPDNTMVARTGAPNNWNAAPLAGTPALDMVSVPSSAVVGQTYILDIKRDPGSGGMYRRYEIAVADECAWFQTVLVETAEDFANGGEYSLNFNVRAFSAIGNYTMRAATLRFTIDWGDGQIQVIDAPLSFGPSGNNSAGGVTYSHQYPVNPSEFVEYEVSAGCQVLDSTPCNFVAIDLGQYYVRTRWQRWKCQNNYCTSYWSEGNSPGEYLTKAECVASGCQALAPRWICGPYGCMEIVPEEPNVGYATEAECLAACAACAFDAHDIVIDDTNPQFIIC